jgi:phosphotriesterase-related protein
VDTQLPSDAERIRTLRGLLDAGYAGRLLLAQDICFRHELVCHGGHGYAHVLRSIRPRLLRGGVPAAAIETILVANPRAWLTGDTGDTGGRGDPGR